MSRTGESWTDNLAMSDCCSPKGYRSIFSEKRAHAEARRYRRRGLDRTSRRIAGLLKQQGIVGRTLLEVATLDTDLREYLKKFTPDERRILERPEEYRGLAAEVAREVASTWRERLKGVLPE